MRLLVDRFLHLRKRTDSNVEPLTSLAELVRLYAPVKGPAHMHSIFIDALKQRRHGVQRGKGSPPGQLAGAAILGAVAVAALGIALLWPSDGGPSRISAAQAFLAQIPDAPPIQSGKVIHQKMEMWSRLGPKAAEVGSWSPVTTEGSSLESWVQVGDGMIVTHSFGITKDANGRAVQESSIKAGGQGHSRVTNLRTGEVLRDRPYESLPFQSEGRTAADEFQAALDDGTGRVISQTDSQLVVEMRNPIPSEVLSRSQELREQASVPYYWDLDPTHTSWRVTFRSDGVILAIEHFVTNNSGNEVLVGSTRLVTYEVLDEMPADIP